MGLALDGAAANQDRTTDPPRDTILFTIPITDDDIAALRNGDDLQSVVPDSLVGRVKEIRIRYEPRSNAATGASGQTGGGGSFNAPGLNGTNPTQPGTPRQRTDSNVAPNSNSDDFSTSLNDGGRQAATNPYWPFGSQLPPLTDPSAAASDITSRANGRSLSGGETAWSPQTTDNHLPIAPNPWQAPTDPRAYSPNQYGPETAPAMTPPVDRADWTRMAEYSASRAPLEDVPPRIAQNSPTVIAETSAARPGELLAANQTGTNQRIVPLLWFMLLASIGLNVYLMWIARGFYARYRELGDELRETFSTTSSSL